jgi:flagellar motor switch protein FliN/FliY
VEEEKETAPAELETADVWMRFSAAEALHGEFALLTTAPGAVQLAQVLMSESVDPAVPYDEGHKEAFAELQIQICGLVATGLKGAVGGEVRLDLAGRDAPVWQQVGRRVIRISGEKLSPIYAVLVMSVELAESFAVREQAKAAAESPREAKSQTTAGASPVIEEKSDRATPAGPVPSPNLELLLDVKLTATIRFGQRRMLLREILEIHPGAAIELDRRVHEPVELLVGGRLIARGEVVIVEGNYGLRITEILSPQQRIVSLGQTP